MTPEKRLEKALEEFFFRVTLTIGDERRNVEEHMYGGAAYQCRLEQSGIWGGPWNSGSSLRGSSIFLTFSETRRCPKECKAFQ